MRHCQNNRLCAGKRPCQVALNTGINQLFLNNGDATFSAPVSLADSKNTLGMVLADMDGDTDLDLVVVNGNIPVLDPLTDAQVAQIFGNLTAQGLVGRFSEQTEATGLNNVGPLLGRGSAMACSSNWGAP